MYRFCDVSNISLKINLTQNFQQPINTLITFGSTIQELEGQLIRLDDVKPLSIIVKGRPCDTLYIIHKRESQKKRKESHRVNNT